jgi:hypothetical protein
VELRWRQQPGTPGGWQLIQDTFLTLNNDYPGASKVLMYFINGDKRLAEVPDIERAHPGCNWEDTRILLTQDMPTYWRASNGQGSATLVPPFTALDPGNPPGRPDPENPNERLLRGYVVAWAVNYEGKQIRWNHLSGSGTVVNYARSAAYEYSAYSSAASSTLVSHGELIGPPGTLNLDGVQYAAGYDLVLLDFFAEGTGVLSGSSQVTLQTDLTLLPLSVDLRQDHGPRVTTKAKFDIWNENEVKFSGVERCITCWDQRLLANYGSVPNHFLIQHLHTNKGRARIDGMASTVCDFDFNPYDGACGAHPNDVCSESASLVGISVKLLEFDGGQRFDAAAANLVGMGTQSAVIRYDIAGGPPPETPGAGLPTTPDQWLEEIDRDTRSGSNHTAGSPDTSSGSPGEIPPE